MRRGDAETGGRDAAARRRGDAAAGTVEGAVSKSGRPFPASPRLRVSASRARGFTLVELVVTVTVMAVLALGAIPLVKTAVRRHKEQQLRESLRMMREAIKEFRRDTIGMQCQGGLPGGGIGTGQGGGVTPPATTPGGQPPPGGAPGGAAGPMIDPRTTVVIADCTIFSVDNPDRYPPDLDTLMNGVNVLPRQQSAEQVTGAVEGNFLDRQQGGALAFKKKVYLRDIPVDPMTGKKDWITCSSWEDQRGESCGGTENVFDVRSRSQEQALNGRDKYSDW